MNNTIVLMVVLALLLALSFVLAYLWALNQGQFDDLETPAQRMLKDDFKLKVKVKMIERKENEKQH